MTSSLVGSEMCIRDRRKQRAGRPRSPTACQAHVRGNTREDAAPCSAISVSYTHLTLPTICSV
eukprot:5458978-Prorocentrum_lima.AAC.1